MKKHTFRALLLPGLLLFCLSTQAQVTTQKKAGQGVNSTNPIVIKPIPKPVPPAPSKPIVITPIPKPTPPVTIKPPTPGVVPPVMPLPPGVPVLPPGTVIVPIIPTYPSAWVGPTIIRETRSEPAPENIPVDPSAVPVQGPPLRLVALLGSLKRLDPVSGADLGLAESTLGVSVGMLIGYAQDKPVRAAGDFFGTPWDGPTCFLTSEDAKQGPFLQHPIMTVNEFQPGPWEIEAGITNQRVSWMRLAVSLFEDRSPQPVTRTVNLPRGRRAAMREVLHRVSWVDKGVSQSTPGLAGTDAAAGKDTTHFGKALATFAEQTMAPVPENKRIGIAEWYFPAQDLGKVISIAPRFMTEGPDGAKLRELRAAAGAKTPEWVRQCEFRTASARYAGELWFVVVPDAAMNAWQGAK